MEEQQAVNENILDRKKKKITGRLTEGEFLCIGYKEKKKNLQKLIYYYFHLLLW